MAVPIGGGSSSGDGKGTGGRRDRHLSLVASLPADPLLNELRAEPGLDWIELLSKRGTYSRIGKRLALSGHHGELDRRGRPHLGHLVGVMSYIVDDAIANGDTWQAMQRARSEPTRTSMFHLTRSPTASTDFIDLSAVTLDDFSAAALVHDWVEYMWELHCKEWERSQPERLPSGSKRPKRPDENDMQVFLAEHLQKLSDEGLNDRILYIADGMTFLPSGNMSRREIVEAQAAKLKRHPLLEEFKTYDFEQNLSEFRMFPYQPALDTVNQIWKYKLMSDILGKMPHGLKRWQDLPAAVLELREVQDIINGDFDMSLSPKERPDVVERLKSTLYVSHPKQDLSFGIVLTHEDIGKAHNAT